MSKYFALEWSGTNEDSKGVAQAPDDCPLDHELINQLHGKSELPFELILKTVKVRKNGLVVTKLNLVEGTVVDYQPNSLAWPLMSEKLKQIVDDNLTGKEDVDWIMAKVWILDNEVRYYVPRFNTKLDVIDEENTMYVPDTDFIIIPCYSADKIKDFQLFPEPHRHELWKITSSLNVGEKLKKAFQKGKITGINYRKVKVV